MKFLNDLDAQMFLVEIKELGLVRGATKNFVPTKEMMESFISNRDSLLSGLKDHRKSQNAKAQWRQNKHKMMKGINTFHKSTEGKRFHRNLGTFLSGRFHSGDTGRNRKTETVADVAETLKAINSAKTHMFIELTYYHALEEQAQLEEMVFNYAAPIFKTIEEKLLDATELDEDETAFLEDITIV